MAKHTGIEPVISYVTGRRLNRSTNAPVKVECGLPRVHAPYSFTFSRCELQGVQKEARRRILEYPIAATLMKTPTRMSAKIWFGDRDRRCACTPKICLLFLDHHSQLTPANDQGRIRMSLFMGCATQIYLRRTRRPHTSQVRYDDQLPQFKWLTMAQGSLIKGWLLLSPPLYCNPGHPFVMKGKSDGRAVIR